MVMSQVHTVKRAIEASKELHNRCLYNKGAVIWYNNRLFKYSDVQFFGEIDNKK